MTSDPDESTRAPLLVLGDDGSSVSDTAWGWVNAHPWPGWRAESMTAHPEDVDIDWGRPAHSAEWAPPWDRPVDAICGFSQVRFLRVGTDPRAMLADRNDADLIVVGLRPVGLLEALWTGSTTEWLLHHPPSPLAVIRTPEAVRNVVACVDGSDHSTNALHAFALLPLAAGTVVTLLAVDDGRTNATAALAAAELALAEHGMEANASRTEGKPTVAILEHLEEHQPELVVLGTRGLTGLTRLRLGSTAAAVVRAAPCSSLVSCEPQTRA